MSTRYLLHSLLTVILIVLPACSPIVSESSTPPSSVEQFSPSFTETSEQALIATEQAMAMAVKTEGALDSAAQPTFTPQPTQTSTLAHLPTLTPIPNSTPAQKGRLLSELRELILRREQDIKIELEPGYYVLVVHAAWQDYGDVNYGFLIEVK